MIYKFSAIFIKIPVAFFGKGKADFQIHMEFQYSLNRQNDIGGKKTKLKDSHILILKLTTNLQ